MIRKYEAFPRLNKEICYILGHYEIFNLKTKKLEENQYHNANYARPQKNPVEYKPEKLLHGKMLDLNGKNNK